MYLTRKQELYLEKLLKLSGGVLIRGPKACGKTEMAKRFSKSAINLETDKNARLLIETSPNSILRGDEPRLIDEWQVFKEIWNYIKVAIDESDTDGKFILTGSSAPDDDSTLHSGAGRITTIDLSTLSGGELGWSDKSVSLDDLFSGRKLEERQQDLDIRELAEIMVTGGWPENIGRSTEASAIRNQSYLNLLSERDLNKNSRVKRDPIGLRRLLASYSRNISTGATIETLAADSGLDRGTVSEYRDLLIRHMIVNDLPAWNTHIRSSARLRKSPKRHLCDPSLAAAALGVSASTLIDNMEYFGFLFESLAVHEIRVLANLLDMAVGYYQDSSGDEVDIIVEKRNGDFIAIEVKMGFAMQESAADSLKRFEKKLTDASRSKLKSMNVIVSSGLCYTRSDGINVVPIGCLG
jgi:predicted AAA+ superfamily ATPase